MTDIEFLEAKLEAYAVAAGGQSGENLRIMFASAIAELKQSPAPTAQAKRLEQSLDKFIGAIGPRAFGEEVREGLRARFGFSRLGTDPMLTVRRVLKRGAIASDSEADVIRSFVSNSSNEDTLGAGEFSRLAALLDDAGY